MIHSRNELANAQSNDLAMTKEGEVVVMNTNIMDGGEDETDVVTGRIFVELLFRDAFSDEKAADAVDEWLLKKRMEQYLECTGAVHNAMDG